MAPIKPCDEPKRSVYLKDCGARCSELPREIAGPTPLVPDFAVPFPSLAHVNKSNDKSHAPKKAPQHDIFRVSKPKKGSNLPEDIAARATRWSDKAKEALQTETSLPEPWGGYGYYLQKITRFGNLQHLYRNHRPLEQPAHSNYVNNKMPKSDRSDIPKSPLDGIRADQVEKLFESHLKNDLIGSTACNASHVDTPLEFQFVKSAVHLEQAELQACLEIVEHTSGNDYKASSIGWKVLEKKKEMGDAEMMYLLIRQRKVGAKNSGRILGFMSFMFTNDDPPKQDRDVVYMYEIHLLKLLRGQGLGSQLVGFLEDASRHCGVTKTMLTVFAANEGARRLYEKLGYVKDACSPEDRKVRQRVIKADYIIMSKELA